MRVTFISLKNEDNEAKDKRLRRVCSLMRESEKTDLYMLPELWNVGFFSDGNYEKCAEEENGETMRLMSKMAEELGAYVFMGSFVEKRDGGLYNTAVIFDREGEACGKYSKIHLFGGEKNKITAGDKICVCDTEFGRIGISICYDLRFPEQYRKMTEMGAEIFLNCAAWPMERLEHWELLNRARAVENQAVCLSVCTSGENNGSLVAGKSYAVSPSGKILHSTEAEVETIEADISEINKLRRDFPVLDDTVKF